MVFTTGNSGVAWVNSSQCHRSDGGTIGDTCRVAGMGEVETDCLCISMFVCVFNPSKRGIGEGGWQGTRTDRISTHSNSAVATMLPSVFSDRCGTGRNAWMSAAELPALWQSANIKNWLPSPACSQPVKTLLLSLLPHRPLACRFGLLGDSTTALLAPAAVALSSCSDSVSSSSSSSTRAGSWRPKAFSAFRRDITASRS